MEQLKLHRTPHTHTVWAGALLLSCTCIWNQYASASFVRRTQGHHPSLFKQVWDQPLLTLIRLRMCRRNGSQCAWLRTWHGACFQPKHSEHVAGTRVWQAFRGKRRENPLFIYVYMMQHGQLGTFRVRSTCIQQFQSAWNAFLSRWQHLRQHYQHRPLDLCHGFRLCKSACKHIQSNQLATSDWGIFLIFLNIRIEMFGTPHNGSQETLHNKWLLGGNAIYRDSCHTRTCSQSFYLSDFIRRSILMSKLNMVKWTCGIRLHHFRPRQIICKSLSNW